MPTPRRPFSRTAGVVILFLLLRDLTIAESKRKVSPLRDDDEPTRSPLSERVAQRVERVRERREARGYQRQEWKEEWKKQWEQYQKDENCDEKEYEASEIFHALFSTQKPRDIIDASFKSVRILLVGTSIALVSVVGIPIAGLVTNGMIGLLSGTLLGLLSATLSMSAAAIASLFQMVTGILNTVVAVRSSMAGMRWETKGRQWVFYYMDREAEELASHSQYVRTTDTSDIKDRLYYDVLGVPTTATTKEIKRAYYKKARVVHPDKNPDDAEAAEKFLKLHTAYQVLSDDEARARYDQWGSSASDGQTATGLPFDPFVFFAILFDSQLVEQYIGGLSIASFAKQLLEYAQRTKEDMVDFQEFWRLWREGSDYRPRKRQLEIAQNLLKRVQDYASGSESKDAFRLRARAEAEKIGESGVFGERLLSCIGEGLRVEAGQFLGSQKPVFGWPKGVYNYWKKKQNSVGNYVGTFRKTVHFVRRLVSLTNITEQQSHTGDGENMLLYLEEVLPDMIEMAWAFIVRDISSTIHGACWRIFADQGSDAKTRQRRAVAVEIIGQEFSRRSNVLDPTTKERTEQYPRGEDIRDRIEVAFIMAQMKANGHDMSNELKQRIRKSQTRKRRAAR